MLRLVATLGGLLLMMGHHSRSESLFYYFKRGCTGERRGRSTAAALPSGGGGEAIDFSATQVEAIMTKPANQLVGTNVLYQPTQGEWPTGYYQHAAIITGWDEQKQLANLIVFPDGATYTVAKNAVKEGSEDGCFQQLGTASKSAETRQRKQKQQNEIFRQLSGVK